MLTVSLVKRKVMSFVVLKCLVYCVFNVINGLWPEFFS
jgi:hypothetical protein